MYLDGGGEYQSLGHRLSNYGIQHLKSPLYTPELVGFAERKHRHLVETGITLLYQASIPLRFWSIAFQTNVYLINHMPKPILNFKSPFGILFHK